MKKIIITNSVIEFYEYDKTVIGTGGYKETKNLERKDENYKNHVIRRRNNVRRLACANFKNDNCKFLTLTFANNETDVKKSNLAFKNFIKRLKYQYKLNDLKYLAVIEFQKRGAIHYHVLLNTPYIPQSSLENLWGNGFVFINKVKNVDNLGAYLLKYMTKDTADVRLQGLPGYLCSRNLNKPIVVSDTKYMDLYETYKIQVEKKIKKCTPVYESTYETDCLGICHYKQFNLDRI